MRLMFSRSWSYRNPDSSVGRPAFVTEFDIWDDRQATAAEQVEASLGGVDLVRLVFCDPHGLARSKTLTADAFRTVLRNGMDFSPGPFLFDTAHAVAVDFLSRDGGVDVDELLGAGDFVVVPDPLTFQLLPPLPPPATAHGRQPRTAWVLGDEYLRGGSPHPLGTRDVLRRVCARYAGHHLAPVIGLEVEWYLTRRLDGPAGNAGKGFGRQGAAPAVAAMNAGYQFNLDSFADSVAGVTGPLAAMLVALGLPLRSMEHESGPGQLEFTFNPMLALDAADAMLLFRTMVKQACARLGCHASFMALPGIESFDPSGWHLHQSVMDTTTGQNVFAADGGEGLSPEGKGYVEGLLARAREYCLLSVPTVNGYRRFAPEFALSPTRIGSSYEDRTAMVRVLGVGGSTHVENRTGEPCANPYLAIAAQLSAGLEGFVGELGPSGSDVLPGSLGESLAAFRDSEAAPQLLGRPLAAALTKIKESEATRFEEWCAGREVDSTTVTDWEQREYFDVY